MHGWRTTSSSAVIACRWRRRSSSGRHSSTTHGRVGLLTSIQREASARRDQMGRQGGCSILAPGEIVDRPKVGLPSTDRQLASRLDARHGLRSPARPELVRDGGLRSHEWSQELLESHGSGSRNEDIRIWTLLVPRGLARPVPRASSRALRADRDASSRGSGLGQVEAIATRCRRFVVLLGLLATTALAGPVVQRRTDVADPSNGCRTECSPTPVVRAPGGGGAGDGSTGRTRSMGCRRARARHGVLAGLGQLRSATRSTTRRADNGGSPCARRRPRRMAVTPAGTPNTGHGPSGVWTAPFHDRSLHARRR